MPAHSKVEAVVALLDSAARIAASPNFGVAQRAMEAAKLQALILGLKSGDAAAAQMRSDLVRAQSGLPADKASQKQAAEKALRTVADFIRS